MQLAKNTSIIEPISTDSPPNDKWGFGLLKGGL